MIKPFGLYGVSFATCASYIAVFIYRYIDTKKYCKINLLCKEFIFGILLLILLVVTINWNNRIASIIIILSVILILILYKKTFTCFVASCLEIVKRGKTNEE